MDLVSKVMSTSIGVKRVVILTVNLVTESHDPLSRPVELQLDQIVFSKVCSAHVTIGIPTQMPQS